MRRKKSVDSCNMCVCDTVKFINGLQDEVKDNEKCRISCERSILDLLNQPKSKLNTRPFLLLTEEGKPFKAFFKSEGFEFEFEEDDDDPEDNECRSPFFRVEKIDEKTCCAVLRVLQPIDDFCEVIECPQDNLVATKSCITVDLNCFCAIQCLDDIFLENV